MNGGGLKSMIKVAAIVSLSPVMQEFSRELALEADSGENRGVEPENYSVWCDLCGGGSCFHDRL